MSSIMKLAWSNFKMEFGTFSECLKLAWEATKSVIKINEVKSLFSEKMITSKLRRVSYSYTVVNKESFNELYKLVKGTFAANVMMTIAKVQHGIATVKQIETIAQFI